MRIIGLDYGSSTIGVAISDELQLTAQGIETIHRKKENHLRKSLARIEELINEYGVNLIVLGYPKNMNNTIGERAIKTEEFAKKLEDRTELEVVLWDERLTTVMAEQTLISGDVRRENRGKIVDKLAAVFILQNYLDFISNKNKK
ncbi:MAG TPA: Holliday junction resolvase RuvX [Clostridiales bacterium]|nr:Holliday junction resolvase RuvX [Clostridiales bacterium]